MNLKKKKTNPNLDLGFFQKKNISNVLEIN